MCFFETSNLLVTRVTNAKDVVNNNNNNNISNNKYIPLLLMCWQNMHKANYRDNKNIKPNTWQPLNEEASEITAGNKQPEYERN